MTIQEQIRYLDHYLDASQPTGAQTALTEAFAGKKGVYTTREGVQLDYGSPGFRGEVFDVFDRVFSEQFGDIRRDERFRAATLKSTGIYQHLMSVDRTAFAIAKQSRDISPQQWEDGIRGNLARNYEALRKAYGLLKVELAAAIQN